MRAQTRRAVISQSVQSYTAYGCSQLREQCGRFWQQETYDHWACDENEMHSIRYIENNPVKAGLVESPNSIAGLPHITVT